MSSQRQEHMKAVEARGKTTRRPRMPYAKPRIIHELELEVRAGSPFTPPDLLNPFRLEP